MSDLYSDELFCYGNDPSSCPNCNESASGTCPFHRKRPGITPRQLTNENINALLGSWERNRAEQDRERKAAS